MLFFTTGHEGNFIVSLKLAMPNTGQGFDRVLLESNKS